MKNILLLLVGLILVITPIYCQESDSGDIPNQDSNYYINHLGLLHGLL